MRIPDRKYLWALNAFGLRLRGIKMQFPTYIGPTLYVRNHRQIELGRRVRIWPGLRIEVYNNAKVTIEDDVALGAFCHITAAEDLVIGACSVYAGWNLITNINHSLENLEDHSLDRPWEISSVHLGERLFVGQGAKILPGSSLGNGTAVGANAVVSRLEAPENSVVAGVPARVIRASSQKAPRISR